MQSVDDQTGGALEHVKPGSRAWSLLALCLLIVGAAAAIGLQSLWPMLNAAWSDVYGAFSHGYLVLALCVWLAVRFWRAQPPQHLQPAWLAVIPLLGTVFALIAMELLFLNSPRLVLLPIVALAVIALVCGWRAARVLLWPTLFLYCALPQWWAINSALQTLTSRVVHGLVEITHLPAYVEGNFIHVPAGVFEIASGCSGLNYLVAALSLAGFYALMYLTRLRNQLWLLGSATALAIVANVIRVYALIVIGIVTDMKHYLVTVEHLYFGWAIFAVAMVPVFWFARRLDIAEQTVAQNTAPRAQVTPIPTVAATVIPAAFVAALIVLLPRFATVAEVDANANVADLPRAFGAWTQSSDATDAWRPVFVNAQEQRASFSRDSQHIELYRAVYPHQTSERRIVRAGNDFFGAGWRLAEQRLLGKAATGFAPLTESRGYIDDRERLMWTWYVVAGAPANSKLEAKIREVQGVFERRRDAMAIALTTECVPSCAAAHERLREFTRESAASLQQR